ncbi:hypothetical protein SDC9_212088 [bioreactor metagenome]|uniref:Uncharacterized protein n=1 Tax=bioreactor metagenome TaxID=1076179 RepID=A0A645JLT3_9ZZZZ
MRRLNPSEVDQYVDVFILQFLEHFLIPTNRNVHLLGINTDAPDVCCRRHHHHREILKGALRGSREGWNGLPLVGQCDRQPYQRGEHQREQLQPKILQE